MILLAHPSGNNFVRETAMAFFDAEALCELHLGIAACGGNAFAKLSRLPGMAEIRRRTYDSHLRSRLRLHPWREGGRLLASRLGWPSLIAHETGPFCIDAVYQSFDRTVARRIDLERGSDPNSAKHAFPSLYEGFGMATAEAMACGCAAVLTPTGFGGSLVNGTEALVRPFQDVDKLSDAARQLLSNRVLRDNIAHAGRKRVSEMTWKRQVDRLDAVYRQWTASNEVV